jgi:RNA polymerase sigma-70 factor (ECF subfamily)
MNEQDRHSLFSDLTASCHSQLYAYIFAIVRNREDASDLFQSVCLILWRKFDSFRPGSNFFAWARQTAKLVVRSFLRHKKHLSSCVGEELLNALAETDFDDLTGESEPYFAALRHCRKKLDSADEQLLGLRYAEELGSREIAERLQRPQTSVCRSLNRIRNWLLECIELELNRQERSGRGLS